MQTATETREWTNGLAARHDLNILLTMSAHASSGPAGAGRVQPIRGQDELRPGCRTVPQDEHDPEKWKPVFPRDKPEAFARKSRSNRKIKPASVSSGGQAREFEAERAQSLAGGLIIGLRVGLRLLHAIEE